MGYCWMYIKYTFLFVYFVPLHTLLYIVFVVMLSFICGCQRWYDHRVNGYGFGISLLGSFMKRVFMLLIFIQLVCCSIKDIYWMGIHKIKWKYIWNFGLQMFGRTAAFPERCGSAMVARAFHCHQIASVYISFNFFPSVCICFPSSFSRTSFLLSSPDPYLCKVKML